MNRLKQMIERITTTLVLASVLVTPIATWAALNVMTRPDMITVAIELPKPKGVVTMWDPIDPEVGLGGSPDWYTDYEAEQRPHADIPNAHYNLRSYTPQEHACLAQNIYFEARNETLKGQIAVALVTLERVEDPRYPNNVCAVVYDDKQFSWYSDGLSDRPKNKKKFDEIALVASAILATDTTLYDYTYGSTHYHADYVEPYWAQYMVRKTKVDTHIFYYEPRKGSSVVLAAL